jgi:hypothetical protein
MLFVSASYQNFIRMDYGLSWIIGLRKIFLLESPSSLDLSINFTLSQFFFNLLNYAAHLQYHILRIILSD